MGHIRNLDLSDLFLNIYHFYMKALLSNYLLKTFAMYNNVLLSGDKTTISYFEELSVFHFNHTSSVRLTNPESRF